MVSKTETMETALELHRYSTSTEYGDDLKEILENVTFTRPCCTVNKCLKVLLGALIVVLLLSVGGLAYMVYLQHMQIGHNKASLEHFSSDKAEIKQAKEAIKTFEERYKTDLNGLKQTFQQHCKRQRRRT